jgi:glyoxylase-like metal-dependent hydrolase (beta-lactamase superfamily II)
VTAYAGSTTAYICKTCGVQHAESDQSPPNCIICDDERQYVGWQGQQWTTLDEMREQGFKNEFREQEPRLTGIATQPWFAIGQRALVVQTPNGNVLWDCISYIDDETVDRVKVLGGIRAIALSHPHFYGSIVEWARPFDATVYIPRADEQWITRLDPSIELFEGAVELVPGVTLVQCGGHFEGSAVLHWAAGAEGRGTLLTGDSIAPAQDRRFTTFMWSYPNYIPLGERDVRGIVNAVRPYAFDRIYGGWWHTIVDRDAKAAVERSAERYIRRIKD